MEFEDKFIRIGITEPGPDHPSASEILSEGKRITEVLKSGRVDLIHIRKPEWSKAETESLIKAIPEELHGKLKLHDHFGLISKYNLGGVHLNSRNPIPPANAANVSKSIHTLAELANTCGTCYDYVTLSPIYDSISKPGYQSFLKEDLKAISTLVRGKKVVALGGVTEEKFPELQSCGFIGGAMLGNLWK